MEMAASSLVAPGGRAFFKQSLLNGILSEIIIHYNFPSYRIELSLKLYGGYI
jgi:hypothetical protein